LNGKKKSKQSEAARRSSSGDPMDLTLLERLVKLMSANDLNTVELCDGDRRITLKRGGEAATVYAMPAGAPSASRPAAAGDAAASAPPAPASEEADLVPIKSPMVGTFYSASSPDAKPFVTVGTVVDEETDVCVIEAMKVFNNIKAECRGTIQKVLVTNGQTVEFGQTLFLVKAG
jgi:acetyl-CoA carboxylase biotin carboxyl carrier protein